MSGHSKWKTIQHKKGAADAKRGKIFSKLSKELMVAARKGGSNPDTNPGLRAVMQKARSSNMPMDNVTRAIKKGAGELEGVSFEEVIYEGYASGGIALIAIVLTDNKNRAASEVRHVFTKHKANMATQGAVIRNFERRGQIFVDAATIDEDKLMGIVLDAGADDMSKDGENFEVLTSGAKFSDVTESLEKTGIKPISAEIAFVPSVYVTVNDKSAAESVLRLISELEDMEDIQNVYTNMDMPDEVANAIEK